MAMAKSTIIPFTLTASVDLTDAATEPAQVAAPAKPIRFNDYVITPISPMKDSDGPVIVEASILRDGCTFIEVGYHGIHLDESNTIAVRDLLNGIIAAGEETKRKTDA